MWGEVVRRQHTISRERVTEIEPRSSDLTLETNLDANLCMRSAMYALGSIG